MSGLIKNIFKPCILRSTGFLIPKVTNNVPASLSRSIWYMSSLQKKTELSKKISGCNCGCQGAFIHTKGGSDLSKTASQIDEFSQGEKELAEFLTEEISAEKELQGRNVPNEVSGFKIMTDGPEVTMVKNLGEETISIKFNVNHSVGEETEYDSAESGPTPKDDAKPILNRPPFDVEIKKGGKVLGFRCSMVAPPPRESTGGEEGFNDLFTIDEVVMSENQIKDNDYHVPGEIMDGTLYDLLMNLLEDKGVTSDLVEKLTKFSTDYEHSLYVTLLERMQKFVSSSK